MKKLSVTVITKDEEKNIRDCLESVKWADEIVIVDDMSIDKTIEISKEYTNKIFERKLDNFSNQKNFAQDKASCDWVLNLDADERVSPELKEEILGAIKSEEYSGYYLARKQYFFGKWIRYGGWYPNYQLKLYRKEKGRWRKPVHERVRVEGKVDYLKSPLLHFMYEDISSWIENINRFTTLQARNVFVNLGDRERWYKPIIFPIKIFFQKFFLLKGFKDGYYGFVIAVLSAFYTFIFRAKLWELSRKSPEKDSKK